MKIKLTVAMALLAGTSAFAGNRLDVVNAQCKNMSEAMGVLHQQTNKPFAANAVGDASFDNPGLVVYMHKILGFEVPADMQKLAKKGKVIAKIAKMQVGDIVFFANPDNKKEINKMGIVQSVAADGVSFSFFYADQKQGIVRIAHSTEDEFRGHFKQANRIVCDEEITKVRSEYQKDVENIEKAKANLSKAQAEVTAKETALKDLEYNFEKKNVEVVDIK